jgi:hypothetical protein
MDGGRGDDALFVGDGDTATGGDGMDDFFLLDGDAVDPATITDFDLAQDALIYVYDAGTTPPMLELTDNGDGTQTLSADNAAVAVLAASGLTVNDVVLFERGSQPGVFL